MAKGSSFFHRFDVYRRTSLVSITGFSNVGCCNTDYVIAAGMSTEDSSRGRWPYSWSPHSGNVSNPLPCSHVQRIPAFAIQE